MDDPFAQTPTEGRSLLIAGGVLVVVIIGIVVALLLGANISNTQQPAAVVTAPTVTAAPAVSITAPAVATTAASSSTTAPAAAATTGSGGAVTGNPQTGLTVFRRSGCISCHLNNGLNAGGQGPQLTNSANAGKPDYVRTIVRNGKGAMQPYDKDIVSDADLENIVAYVQSIRR